MIGTYEAEVCVDGVWHCQPVLLINEVKELLAVDIEKERQLFEAGNKVPNGVFWAVTYYNFTKGTDQTTWMLFNNKWQGWIDCARSRAALVDHLEVESDEQ